MAESIFFLIRGALLMLFQVFAENQAWTFGDMFMSRGAMTFRGGVPGAGSRGDLYLGVLFAFASNWWDKHP